MNLKSILTKYLFLVFIVLTVLLYWSDSMSDVVMGTGTWNLNKMNGRSWIENPVFNAQIFIWVLMHVSTVIYSLIYFFRKSTQLVVSSLHIVLVLTYVQIPVYWLFTGWLYHIISLILLVLNLIYAFWIKKELPKTLDDVLDA